MGRRSRTIAIAYKANVREWHLREANTAVKFIGLTRQNTRQHWIRLKCRVTVVAGNLSAIRMLLDGHPTPTTPIRRLPNPPLVLSTQPVLLPLRLPLPLRPVPPLLLFHTCDAAALTPNSSSRFPWSRAAARLALTGGGRGQWASSGAVGLHPQISPNRNHRA